MSANMAWVVTRELLFGLDNNRQDNGKAIFPFRTLHRNGKLRLLQDTCFAVSNTSLLGSSGSQASQCLIASDL